MMLPALLKKFIKHCGAAIESLIIKTCWVACFYLATAKMIDKSLFAILLVIAKRQSRRKHR